MLERLEEIVKKHEDLQAQQADPEIAVDPNRSREVAQKLAELEPVETVYRDYCSTASELEGAREIVAEADDDEMKQMGEAEVDHHRATVRRQHDVGRLEVSVHDAGFVQRRDAARDTQGQGRRLAPREGAGAQP